MIVKSSNCQNGFTFLEVIIAVAIVMSIVGAIFVMQDFIVNQQTATINAYLTVDAANRGTEGMVRELRNARNGANGAYIFEQVDDQAITFFSDVDNDSTVERVRYFLDGTVLKKGVTEPMEYPINYPLQNEKVTEVADGIRNYTLPVFSYYNADWPEDTTSNPLPTTTRRLQTRLVGIRLLSSASEDMHTNYEITTYVHIRSLKDNF